MNIDRGKESFTDQEVQDLRVRARAWKDNAGLSWEDAGKLMGIKGGTLSPWATGSYNGDNKGIAYQVNKFFLAEEERLALELEAPSGPDFLPTPTSRQIHAQLRWAQRGKIVVITGESGIGKTAAIEQYAASVTNVVVATMSEGTPSPTSMLTELLRAMGQPARSGGIGGVQALTYMVIDRVSDRRALIILDEAQYLSDRALNQLRFIHDKTKVGLALAGNTDVMGRIRHGSRGGAAPFAQLHSRVSMPHHYAKPDNVDVGMLLDAWKVERPKEREFLTKIAMQPGCLRELGAVLEIATLIARQSDEERVLAHLQAAWTQLARKAAA